jgi:predicted dehydrogenase
MAHIHVNWLSPTKIRTTVIGGSRRTIVWDDLDPLHRVAVHDRGVDLIPKEPDQRREALISYRLGDIHVPALPEQEALRAVMAEFAAAIGESRPALTDGRAGLRVITLLEAASRSIERDGAIISLKENE